MPQRPRGRTAQTVAVVVPIHNVEEYLDECLESLAAQTVFADLEVVLVDDGSTDRSGVIAAAFAQRYDNVLLLSEPNRGAGAARNRGLQEVTAELVTFLDSDDRLPSDAVSTMRRLLLQHDADVAIGAMRTFPQVTKWPWLQHLDEDSKLIPGIEHAPELVHGAGPCNKLFRTAMLRERGLAFAEGTHFEDVYLTLPVLLSADRIAVTRKVIYDYRQRASGGSIMNSLWSRTDNFWDHLAVEEFLDDLRTSLPTSRRPVLDLFMVRSFQGFALRAPDVLVGQDLDRYFDRAVAVYGGMGADAIERGCLDARHRLAFVAFLLGDRRLFADRSSGIEGLDVVDGELRLRLREQPPQEILPLLRATRSTVVLESMDVVGDGQALRLTGRLSVDGLPHADLLPTEARLELTGSGAAGTARVFEDSRTAATAPAANAWKAFSGDVRVRDVSGLRQFRLTLQTPAGSVALPMHASSGALRAARELHLDGARAVLVKQGVQAGLRIRAGARRWAGVRWATERLLDDVKHALRRRPLWRPRLVRSLTRPFAPRDIWILGERRDTAQDNAFALFRHLREQRPDIRAYYVLDRASEQYPRVSALGRVVPHSSLRHKLLMLHARVLVNAYDLDAYLLPDGWRPAQYLQYLHWRIGSRRVFLQHGVIYNDVSRALHRSAGGLDVFVASAEAEAHAIRSGMGYDSQVAVTGLPRFDHLDRAPVGRRILVMPTWRSTLVAPSYARDRAVQDFAGSRYAMFWRSVLGDPRLLDLLESTGTTVEFYAHYEMTDAVQGLVPQHDSVVVSSHRTRSVQEAILDASLFVTDWSSTFFDAAYAGRPVVMAPFDEEEFRATQYEQGYFDLRRDGFGPAVTTPDALVTAMRRYVENGFEREPEYDRRAGTFFAYRDAGNCARVVDATERMLRGERPAAAARREAERGLAPHPSRIPDRAAPASREQWDTCDRREGSVNS